MNTMKTAFELNDKLECLYKDNDSDAWFPDPVRAAKNFKNGYTKVSRESVLNPKKKTNARTRKPTNPAEKS